MRWWLSGVWGAKGGWRALPGGRSWRDLWCMVVPCSCRLVKPRDETLRHRRGGHPLECYRGHGGERRGAGGTLVGCSLNHS